jgi:hypothetical protein
MSKEEKRSELGSYAGFKQFSYAIKRDGKYKFTKSELQECLDNQDALRYKSLYDITFDAPVSSQPASMTCGTWI